MDVPSVSQSKKRKLSDVNFGLGKGGPRKRSFKQPETEDKTYKLSNHNFSVESRRKIRWAINMYNQWRILRMSELYVDAKIRRTDMNFVNDLSKEDLCYSLSRFIREVRRVDEEDFPPNSIKEIIIMVQMHLHQSGV